MTSIHRGPAFPSAELSEEELKALRAELAWLEEDLKRRRDKLRHWDRRRQQIAAHPGIPEDLRAAADHWHAQAENLVSTGERLRAYLLLQLKEQPEYADAYHYTH